MFSSARTKSDLRGRRLVFPILPLARNGDRVNVVRSEDRSETVEAPAAALLGCSTLPSSS